MRMPRSIYFKLVNLVNSLKPSVQDVTEIISEYPGLSHYTFNSIRSQEYQKKMKKSHHLKYSPDVQDLYYKRYRDGVSKGRQYILLDMADEVDLSLALLARIILEKHLAVTHRDGENISRSFLTQLMKEPNLIEDPILATEISQCIYSDDFYGPLTDSIKHAIGYEYEFKLKRQLGKLGHSFIGEDQMRLKGYDKTPDVKLEIPIAVDGYVVNWIESKASFGDDFSHKTYLKDQFWSYWNRLLLCLGAMFHTIFRLVILRAFISAWDSSRSRFGPGMVIYWFGFIEDLDVNQDKGIILRYEFPENIVKMNPLG